MTRSGQQRGPANDEGFDPASSAGAPEKSASESRYYFEICQVRHQNPGRKPIGGPAWLWRLISPTGAAVIECGGYADAESCRAAVTLLQEKAGAADVSFNN